MSCSKHCYTTEAAAAASAHNFHHFSEDSNMETPCETTDAKTVLAQFKAFLEAKSQAVTDKRASKTDCGKKGAKDALKSILTIDFGGRDIRILTSKELYVCFENAHANYHKQLDTLEKEWSQNMFNGKPVTAASAKEKKKQEKLFTKVIKHLGDVKNIQNLMLAINCFQESQANVCDQYVEEAIVEMTEEEIAKADQVEIMDGKRERKQVQHDDMVSLEVEDEDEFQLVQCDCKCWRRVHKNVLDSLPKKVYRVCDTCEMMHEVIVPAGQDDIDDEPFKCGDVKARCYEDPARGREAAHQLFGNGAWREEDHSPVGFSCSTIGLTCGKSVTCICCGEHMKLNDIDRQYYLQGEMDSNGVYTKEPGDWQHADFGQQCPLIETDGDYQPEEIESESEEEYQESESEEEYEDETDEETDEEASKPYECYEYRKINGKHVRFLVKEVGGGNYEESDHEKDEECEAPVSEKKYDEGGVIEEAYYDEYGVVLQSGNEQKREELPEAEVISDVEEVQHTTVEHPQYEVLVPPAVDNNAREYTLEDFDTLVDDSDIFA